MTSDLEGIGYRSAQTVEGVSIRKGDKNTDYLVLYVDDMLIFTEEEDEAREIVSLLQKIYEIKDLGDAEYFLGIKISRPHKNRIELSQTEYIKELLERFEIQDCKPCSTPLTPTPTLYEQHERTADEQRDMENVPYREAIGALLFLSTRTRPDIAVPITVLAKH